MTTSKFLLSLALTALLLPACGGVEPTPVESQQLARLAEASVIEDDLPGCEGIADLSQSERDQAVLLRHPDAPSLVVVAVNARMLCIDTLEGALQNLNGVGVHRPLNNLAMPPAEETSDTRGNSGTSGGIQVAFSPTRVADDPIPIVRPLDKVSPSK